MRKAAYLLLVALVLLLGAETATAAAAAPAAPAATEPRILSLTVDTSTVVGGKPFTATARSNKRCAWILEFHGDRRTAISKSFRTTFVTPRVTKKTVFKLQATCFTPPSASGRTAPSSSGPGNRAGAGSADDPQSIVVRIPGKAVKSLTITVTKAGGAVAPPTEPGGQGPDGNGNGPGDLPDTGGPSLEVLLAALAAILAGGVLIAIGSRKKDPEPASA